MEIHDAVEKLKSLIIENDLPRTEMAVFGIKCPYCGKSDRIRTLEPPEDLVESVDSTNLEHYTALWQRLNPLGARLGVCRFCLNPLALAPRQSQAKALDQL